MSNKGTAHLNTPKMPGDTFSLGLVVMIRHGHDHNCTCGAGRLGQACFGGEFRLVLAAPRSQPYCSSEICVAASMSMMIMMVHEPFKVLSQEKSSNVLFLILMLFLLFRFPVISIPPKNQRLCHDAEHAVHRL